MSQSRTAAVHVDFVRSFSGWGPTVFLCFLSTLILLFTVTPARAFHSFERTAIDTNVDGQDVVPVDFDGDGHMDVVTQDRFADEFAWYENDGTNMVFTKHMIDSGITA